MTHTRIFSGSSHPALAMRICSDLGCPIGASSCIAFSNENLHVRIDDNVRGCDTYVIQTAAPPLHTHMMELFIMCDTLRACGARSVCAVIPYFPYIRSDKQDKPGVGIIARLCANLLENSGATSAILLDLHSPQSQGFFRIPVEVLTARNILAAHLQSLPLANAVLVSPDAGEVKDLEPYTEILNLSMAVIDKRRIDDSETPHLRGIVGDVSGKTAILVDDEIASAETICRSARFLRERGAQKIWALCTHPVFSGNAVQKLIHAPIDKVIVTDSVPLPPEKLFDKLEVLSTAPVFAAAIKNRTRHN